MFYFYFQDQYEEEFQIQVDVLMYLLVFQDQHYDHVDSLKKNMYIGISRRRR